MNNEPAPTVALPATPQDAEAVIALWEVCGLTRPWNNPQSDFERAMDGENSTVLVLRKEEAVFGSVMVGDDGHRGWVYYLAVHPDAQRKGAGRALMIAAEGWLTARGCPKIQLMVRSSNAQAFGFYERIGYAAQDVITLGRFLDG